MEHVAEAIRGPASLRDRPQLLPHVLMGYATAQMQGDIPIRRSPPSGEEMLVWGEAGAEVAFATFFETSFRRVWIDVVYVPMVLRRRGIGTALLKAVRDHSLVSGAAVSTRIGDHPLAIGIRRFEDSDKNSLWVFTITKYCGGAILARIADPTLRDLLEIRHALDECIEMLKTDGGRVNQQEPSNYDTG